MSHRNTIGIDLGDKKHVACVLDADGKEMSTETFTNNKASLTKFISAFENAVVAIEACLHSPWISRLLEKLGHTVYVANPRKLRFIWGSDTKTDKRDAQMLAEVAYLKPSLLHPITHRSEDAQRDLQIVKGRDGLVAARTALINSVRSAVKVMGERIPSGWSTGAFAKKALEELSERMLMSQGLVIEAIQELTDRIHILDKTIERLSEDKYPITKRLRQVKGVGPVTALTFILAIDDPTRFNRSREVGPFLGLVPKRDQSGDIDKQLHITKAGNSDVRKLLVGCAQYILGSFGEECRLRRWGEKIAARGGKNAKKRAIVAVARKLAVLLHRLWVSDEEYDPFYGSKRTKSEASKEDRKPVPRGTKRRACSRKTAVGVSG